jgi:uncharacterized protein YbjT (DUF2867 family)
MQATNGRIALVAGGSGLVGSHLLRELLASPSFTRVIALSRRPLPLEHPRLANRILRFESLETELRGVSCQDAFCCLGTTLRQAGSLAAFRAVDHDLVLRFARFAQTAGAQQLLCISSVGANADSKHDYLRVKGEAERALEALRFPALQLLQPGLLLGRQRDRRLGEMLAGAALMLVNPLLLGRAQQWRAIPASTVATAMAAIAQTNRRGVHRYLNDALVRLGSRPVPTSPSVTR